MGVSKLEYEANVNLQHLVALYFLLRRLRPHTLLTLENPGFDKGLCMHPLIRHVIEAPIEEGGLGVKLIPTSYCLHDPNQPQKVPVESDMARLDVPPHLVCCLVWQVTFFWSNSRNHAHKSIEIMSDGTPRLLERCGKGDCSCGDLKKHGARRNHVRGAGHSRNTDTCVPPRPNLLRPCFGHSFGERNDQRPCLCGRYPRSLCESFGVTYQTEISRHQKIDKDDIAESDGHFGHCCATFDRAANDWRNDCTVIGEDVHLCCGCPRAFHLACIPTGALFKPSHDASGEVFLCELCAPVGWQALKTSRDDPYVGCYEE